jgi:tetratricopeptide (TPR) repeat protein
LNGPRLAHYMTFSLYPTGNLTVNETKAASLAEENRSDSYRASFDDARSATTSGASLQIIEATALTETPDGQEAYERGTALKNVGLFRQAAEHFEQAAQDPAYALKGFAQMGLSLKKSGKQEEAVVAFRRALQVSATLLKAQVQILYLLGRTLESLERIPEALESYRWLRREAPQYRDVAMRIEMLSTSECTSTTANVKTTVRGHNRHCRYGKASGEAGSNAPRKSSPGEYEPIGQFFSKGLSSVPYVCFIWFVSFI